MKWFKHDSNANTDAKLKRVRMKYGMQGYGLYWYCLELIASNVEKHNLTFELEHDAEVIAFDTGINYEVVQEMMTCMADLGLFENCEGVITCLKMASRTDEYTQQIMKRHDSVPRDSRVSPDKVRGIRREEKRIEENRKELKTPSSLSAKADPIPVTKIIDLYHSRLPQLPKCQKLTKAREGYIKQRWREDMPAMSNWENFFDYVAGSQFLTGRTEPRDGKRPFLADLEWITKASNFAKILEGKYHGI